MIPPTRPSRPHSRADTFAFGSGEAWRSLRLVLDDDTLTTAESAELLAFGHYPEVELMRTTEGEEADADGFVTNRDFLRTDRVSQQAPAYTTAEAMALVGLALRLHGNASIGGDLADLRLSGSMYQFVLGRELTHAGWRWFSGCVATSHATKSDTAINLGQAALKRLQRVLQIRDRLHAQAKIPSTPTVGDELVFQFETLLLFLSATFDAAARVAHLVYFDGDYKEAGWRRRRWADRLAVDEPRLEAFIADGTPGGTVLKLISRMRNSIHGAALRTITLQPGGRPAENPVELGAIVAAKTMTDIVSLGDDPAAWVCARNTAGRTSAPTATPSPSSPTPSRCSMT